MRKIVILFLFASLLFLTNCSTENTPIYSITTDVNPPGAGTVSPSSGEYDEGTEVDVMAIPNEHWVFKGWEGDYLGNQNPASILMDTEKSITAQFIKRKYPLSISVEGEGIVREEVIHQKTTDYSHGTVVQLTANPAEGWEFIEWRGDIEGIENIVEIEVDKEIRVTAIFEIQSFTITIQVEGEGNVILDPDNEEHEPGEEIEITAKPAEGWDFSHWEGDITGSDNPSNIIADSNKSITAIFELAPNTIAIGFPSQGSVTLFEANNAPKGVVFVSTEEVAFDDGNEGLWRSEDYGQTWEKTSEVNVNFITIAYNEPNIVFAGHREEYLISQDGGVTWDNGALSGGFRSFNNAAIVTANDGIYATVEGTLGVIGLYKSTNLGRTWQHILSSDDVSNSSDARLAYVELSANNTNVIYTSTGFNYNLWKSTNGGDSFSSIKSGVTISTFVFSGIAVNPINSKEVLIHENISNDGGSTWNQKEVSPSSNIWIDNTLIKVENNSVFGSNDLGDSWTEIVQLLGDNLPWFINPELFLSKDALFIKTRNDVFKTDLSVIKSNL